MLHEYTLSAKADTQERHDFEARCFEAHSPYPATKPVVLRREGKNTVYGIDADEELS